MEIESKVKTEIRPEQVAESISQIHTLNNEPLVHDEKVVLNLDIAVADITDQESTKKKSLDFIPESLKPQSYKEMEIPKNTSLTEATKRIKKQKKSGKLFSRLIPKTFSKA